MNSTKKILMLGLVAILVLATVVPISTAREIKPLKPKKVEAIPLELKGVLVMKAPDIIKAGEKFHVGVFIKEKSSESELSNDELKPAYGATVQLVMNGKVYSKDKVGKSGFATLTAPPLKGVKEGKCFIIASLPGFVGVIKQATIVNYPKS